MNVEILPASYPATPGFKDRDTSRAAALAAFGRSRELRQKCLDALDGADRTADEIASILGESVLAIRPRMTELLKTGRIIDSGIRRQNASHRRAKVWRLMPKAA